MDCEAIRRELSALADGELSPERVGAVEKHLADCASCARAQHDWESIRERFEALPREKVPEGLAARTMDRIRGARMSLQSTTRFLRIASAAAAILLLATSLAILLTSPGSPPAQADLSADLAPDAALDRMMTEIVMDNAPAVAGEGVDR